jgi:hypothetical protein
MKTILLILALLFATPSCQFTPEQAKIADSIGRPIAIIQVKKYVEKKPSNRVKVISFISKVENYSKETLELSDFAELTKSVGLDSDWAILMDSVYNSYKGKFSIPSKDKVEKVKSYILDILKDAILLAEPQK